MKQISILFLLLVIITSCQRNELQSIAKEVLSKELTEVQADSGLVILIKDNEIAAKVNLISDNGIYKEGDEQSFQTKKDMGTLLSTACMMAALDDCITPTDTIDVGAGIYLKDGKEIRDHNADKGGYGVLTAEQVIAYDSKIGITKILERCNQVKDNLSKMGFSLHVSPMEIVTFYNRIANEDTTCVQKR